VPHPQVTRRGTHFTCFTSTKVQILTLQQDELLVLIRAPTYEEFALMESAESRQRRQKMLVLDLLALLVKKNQS
jgi:hypothetical protein